MSATEQEERAQFTLAMRAKGINDLGLLRALERAPRALFMPQRFADISGRDIALPIGCGQTSPPPSIVAAMIAALELKPSHRCAKSEPEQAIARRCSPNLRTRSSRLSGSRRWRSRRPPGSRPSGSPMSRSGGRTDLSFHRSGERFDRVIVHGLIEPPAEAFRDLIVPGGVLVAAVAGPERGEQRIVRLAGDHEWRARGRRLRSGARLEAARARARARLVGATRSFDAPDFDDNSQPPIHLKPSLNSIGANCVSSASCVGVGGSR